MGGQRRGRCRSQPHRADRTHCSTVRGGTARCRETFFPSTGIRRSIGVHDGRWCLFLEQGSSGPTQRHPRGRATRRMCGRGDGVSIHSVSMCACFHVSTLLCFNVSTACTVHSKRFRHTRYQPSSKQTCCSSS